MRSEFKDILKIDLPHICGDPIISISFDLTSDTIILSFPLKRIYNLKNIEVVKKSKSDIVIKCNDKSVIYIYSDFMLLNDVYYYPFISSVFSLEKLKIKTKNYPRLEVSISDEYKSLSFLSYVQDSSGEKHIKQMETWANNKGVFYFPLFSSNKFQFTLRATGRSINYGLIHITLPLMIFLLGFLIKYGNLPKAVADNSSSILLAVLLTFTPLYIGILQDFLSKSFMSLNIGIALYAQSYLISFLFIVVLEVYTKAAIYLVLFELIWLLFFLISVRNYFNSGRFNHIIDFILYKPIIYFIQKRYKKAWGIQKLKK